MIGEIIAIGDELTSGRILNTTSNFAAGNLFDAGHEIIAMATIGDDPEVIAGALLKALGRADFVVVTGGLGATSDDLTNETVAGVLGRTVIFYPEVYTKMQSGGILSGEAGRGRGEKHPFEKLAWLPAGAKELKPDAKMAGHMLIHDGTPIFFLPGVPHEMKELLLESVIPWLATWKEHKRKHVRHVLYKVFGLTETEINTKLQPLEDSDPLVHIGYYPVFPEVHLSLTALGVDEEKVDAAFQRFDAEIVSTLGQYLFGRDEETMQDIVGRLLKERKMTMATAESCTGGLIAHTITRVAGSSDYFLGGVVAYSNDMKAKLLGVKKKTLTAHGAVSAETARAMAEGARRVTGADLAISVTGIAGPTGGSDEKPIGTVWFGLADTSGVRDFHSHFSGVRWKVQTMTAMTALDLIRRSLLDLF